MALMKTRKNSQPKKSGLKAGHAEEKVQKKKRINRRFTPPPENETERLDDPTVPAMELVDEIKLYLNTNGENIADLLIDAKNNDPMAVGRLVMLITKSVEYLNQVALQNPDLIRGTAENLIQWPVISGNDPTYNKRNKDLLIKIGLGTSSISERLLSETISGSPTDVKKWAHDLILYIDECRSRISFFKPLMPESWDMKFSAPDFKFVNLIVKRLTTQSDSPSKYLWDCLSNNTKKILTSPTLNFEQASSALAEEFNTILQDKELYKESRFAGVEMSEETLKLSNQKLLGEELIRFHRFLLEDAFPLELRQKPRWLKKSNVVRLLNKESIKQLESLGGGKEIPDDVGIPQMGKYLTEFFSDNPRVSSELLLECINLPDLRKNPQAWWNVAYKLLMDNTFRNPEQIEQLREIGMKRAKHISGLDLEKSSLSDTDVYDPKKVDDNIRSQIFTELQEAFLFYAHQLKVGGSFFFTVDDFVNFNSLLGKFLKPSDRLSKFLWENFSPHTRRMLRNPKSNKERQKLCLVEEFNKVIDFIPIFDDGRFQGVNMSQETIRLKSRLDRMQKPQLVEKSRLNRLLLEDAYPQQLRQNQNARIVG